MVCFILDHVGVDKTESHRDSDIISSDARTVKVVALKCERFPVAYEQHSLDGPGFLSSAPTDVETQHIRSSTRF